MNCENIKKGDIVEVCFNSFLGSRVSKHTVKRVNKLTFVLENDSKYWKIDGKAKAWSPFTEHYVTKIL